MGKCRTCRVEILDETDVCPLCRSILEPTAPVENMYPNVKVHTRQLTLVSNIYLFFAICLEAALIFMNVLSSSQIWWSAITGLALLYVHLLLRYAVLGKSGYRNKIIVLSAITLLSAIAVDMVIGYQGWSVDYVLPVGIVLVDVILLGCMVCNWRNWQSYMMWQLIMILCSIVPVVLYLADLEHNPHLAFLPITLSSVIFLGTLIIGDRRARIELRRRFHI